MNKNRFYQEEWETRRNQKFRDYARNLVLPEFFAPTKTAEKVLDVASGNGVVAEYLQMSGYDVSVIDISREAIKQAKKRGIQKAYVGDVENKLPFKSFFFDCIFWGDNIEHVFYPARVLDEIKRVLKNKGRLILSTPNMDYILYRWHYFKTGQIPATEGIASKPWEWKHIRFFNYESLVSLLKSKGFYITRLRGVNTPSLHNYLSRFFPKLFASIIILEAVNENKEK